jgi:phosphate transport system protein
MTNMNIGHHISQQYNEELEAIRNRVLSMGGEVEQQLANAITALVEGNAELAELVVSSDYKVNALEVAIDEDCSRVLARRQPAAGDLRLIVAVIKTITDLERIGDEAERIGRMAIHLGGKPGTESHYTQIGHLGNHVRTMMHDALDAFARMDPEQAVRVWQEDRKVDQEYEAIMRQLITYMMEDPRSIPQVLDVIWSARSLERIGDRASNICEYVIYLVKGKDVRHTSLEKMDAEVGEEG